MLWHSHTPLMQDTTSEPVLPYGSEFWTRTPASLRAVLTNDHPSTISRRNVYNEDITKWSSGVVKVNADTGMISLHGKDWYQPETISSMSGKERAYLIAGNLSAVYHDGKKPTATDVHRGSDNLLYVGAQPIIDLSAAQNPTDLTNRLQQLI